MQAGWTPAAAPDPSDATERSLIATHDPMLIDLADRVVELRDGRVVA